MLKDLVLKNRSYRRFDERFEISKNDLMNLVELARLTPSSVNWQPLRFALVYDKEINAKIFENLAWAGLLKEWKGPDEGERPTAYIVILCDNTVAKNMKTDVGIVAQTMMLGAAEKGLGGCMIGSVNRDNVYKILNIDKKHCLNELKINNVAEIEDINIKNERLKNRLFDMGFTKGVKVKIKKIAPLGDPVCIEIRGYEIGLRKEELKGIVVRDCK